KKNAVKFVQLLRSTIGLNGNIVVGNGRRYFDAVGQVTADLQVKIGSHHRILVITEGYTSAETTIVVDVSEIEEITSRSSHSRKVGRIGLADKKVDHAVVVHSFHRRIQPRVEHAVLHHDAI